MNTPTTPKKIGALYAIDKYRISFLKEEDESNISIFYLGEDMKGSLSLTIKLTQEMRSDLLQILQGE